MAMTTQGWADLYAWRLDRASRTPLSRQICMQVRAAVLSGALGAGTRMPSSRAMASLTRRGAGVCGVGI
jgi:GntR family transcriptional regulator / MocR family aminotransferase